MDARLVEAIRKEAFIQGFIEALDPKTAEATLQLLPQADEAYAKWRRYRDGTLATDSNGHVCIAPTQDQMCPSCHGNNPHCATCGGGYAGARPGHCLECGREITDERSKK